ncbi:hypothetical protein [Senegalia massiliensis]|uniref:Uncharacterized protein n=1 Tax=Senegalia massiliensis TaxID=1720316 RepID=A0A845QSH4_9CLOT|nr:hypothetical protein [Senegalia massiliensis]NBI05757.1 hypothetical protein [Senegalia massiliensis]
MNIIESPYRTDDYELIYKQETEDILKVTHIKGNAETTEIFDFTGLADGRAESIIAEILPLNPILSAERVNGVLIVEVLRIYSKEEKHIYEGGSNNG